MCSSLCCWVFSEEDGTWISSCHYSSFFAYCFLQVLSVPMPELQLLTKEILKPSWGTFTGSWRLKDMDKAQENWSMLKKLMKLDLFLRQLALPCTSTSFFPVEGMQMLWLPLHFWKYKACHKRLSASMWFIAKDTASSEHFFYLSSNYIFIQTVLPVQCQKALWEEACRTQGIWILPLQHVLWYKQLYFLMSFSTEKTR